ncbi:iron complex outermembrane receptor protein [Nitrobacteraceae bacterium AZCC 1564]
MSAPRGRMASVLTFEIAPGKLSDALTAWAKTSGLKILAPSDKIKDVQTAGATGRLTSADALHQLLSGTELDYRMTNERHVTVFDPKAVLDAHAQAAGALPTVEVTETKPNDASSLPPVYAGGQVASGAKLGLLGNRGVFDTPFNTTSYTSKTIEDQQAKAIGDVLANDPSVRILSSQPNGGETFFIRGFPVANANVAFDGLYGVVPYWKGSVASAERIEVVKGPGALLFGMAPGGSVGGSVNIVPKRAGDEPLTRVIGNYVADSNFGGQVDVGRRFGDQNEFGVRFNGVYRDGETYRDTSQRQGEVALGLDYRGERARVSLDLGYLDLRYNGTEGAMFAGTNIIPPAPDARKQIFQPWTYYNSQTLYGAVRGEVDVTDNVTVYAAAGGRNYKDQYLLPFGSGLTAAGNFTENFSRANEYWNAYTAETGIRAKFDTGFVSHRVSVAASTLVTENGSLSDASLPPVASNIYNPTFVARPTYASFGALPKTAASELNGVAVADTLSVLQERIQFIVGARYQEVQAENFNATTGVRTSNYESNAVSPAFGVVVKPVESISLYANYIEGLSAGLVAPPGTNNAGQVFPPIVSKQTEGGVKFKMGALGATVGYFDITLPSIFNDNNTYVMNGLQRNSGVEFNVFGEITPGLRALGGFMFLEAELEKTAGGTFDGNMPTNVPRRSVNLGVEWDTPFIHGLTLTARGIYTSSVYVNQANTQVLPDWTRYDVGARYKIERANGKPVTIVANVINVFDKAYWSSASLYRGAPRTFMLSTVFDF